LLRPLLSWRRADLEQVCAEAGVDVLDDPSNSDTRFERVRVRSALAEADWLDEGAVAASADHLADADEALDWAVNREWSSSVTEAAAEIVYSPAGAPAEIERRLMARAILSLAEEGNPESLRARELDRLLATLRSDGTATLRGVLCSGGEQWRFSKAPPRKTTA
jgi:tRNA(Ile)-lysidine synthase